MSIFESFSRPEDAGVSSAGLKRFIAEADANSKKVQFHGLMLLRHGKLVASMSWAPYDTLTPHTLYSLSKSFCSAAAGFAVNEGLLSWDSSVVDLLPEEIPEGREEELSPVTLKTLLSMGSGLDPASDSHPGDGSVTWARHVLSHKVMYPPMTHFHYNTAGTYLVSCMVQKAARQTIRDYLMPRLFDKLGITRPEWELSPQGICCGGYGLHLSVEDISRFGQCLLNRGLWKGERVLPEGWVELATREHIANYEKQRQDGNEWGQGYGYQFWRCMDGRYRGDGMFGQLCIVDEARDAVLAATCATNDMGLEMKLIREHIFSAFDREPSPMEETRALRQEIASLGYAGPADDMTPLDRALFGRMFFTKWQGMNLGLSFEESPRGILKFRFQFSPQEFSVLELKRGAPAPVRLPWSEGKRYFGYWLSRGGMPYICIRSTGDPNTMDGRFLLSKDGLVFDGTGVGFPQDGTVFRAE